MVAGRALVRPGLSLHQQQDRLARQDGSGHLVSTLEPGTEAVEACEDTLASLGEESTMGVSHQLQCKPLRWLGLARKADTKAMGPVSILPVQRAQPTLLAPSKVRLRLGTTSPSRPVWPGRRSPLAAGTGPGTHHRSHER